MGKKVFVITEAASEIGKAIALNLAKTGETVVIVARDEKSGDAISREITQAVQNPSLDLELCDLSILSSVRNLSEILKSKHEKINALIHHAAVYNRTRQITVDGFEETFAANYLGPFLLTNLLLERLQTAVQADGSARVLNVIPFSNAQLNFDDLQSEENFNSKQALERAGMATLLFTFTLAQRLEGTGIVVNAIDPGSASRPSSQTVEDIVQSATAPEFGKITGKVLREGKEIAPPIYARDQNIQQKLWEISEDLTELSTTKGITPINDPHLE